MKKIIISGISFVFVILLVASLLRVSKNEYRYVDANNERIHANPLIGFAVMADNIEAAKDATLVYFNILWSDIEPKEGEYAFDSLYERYQIDTHKAMGKKAVIRFVCDKPSKEEHMDIPQWLYEKTQDGKFYDISYGKGYSPDYSNPIFVEAHKRAIEAIAKEFCQDNFVVYIELGSLGHWGEWHVKTKEDLIPMPKQEIAMQYVEQYMEAFPDTRLLMRRPFQGVKDYQLGVYNDMTGDEEATNIWLGWLQEGGIYTEPEDDYILYGNRKFYEYGVVGGEFTSDTSWEDLLVKNKKQTLDLIQNSHMSFIGPHVPNRQNAKNYLHEANRIKDVLGYKLGISEVSFEKSILGEHQIKMYWNNKGIAPIYYNWPAYLYFYDENDQLIEKQKLDIDLTQIMPDTSLYFEHYCSWPEKTVSIGVAIEDPMFEKPAIRLNNATCNQNKVTMIYKRK